MWNFGIRRDGPNIIKYGNSHPFALQENQNSAEDTDSQTDKCVFMYNSWYCNIRDKSIVKIGLFTYVFQMYNTL